MEIVNGRVCLLSQHADDGEYVLLRTYHRVSTGAWVQTHEEIAGWFSRHVP